MNFSAKYLRRASTWVFVGALSVQPAPAQSQPQLIQIGPARLWQRTEFQILNTPSASNPFDPDVIRLDAEFTLPSGRLMRVPAFWYQPYQRGLSSGRESLTAAGPAAWRLRFTAPEAGNYSVALSVKTNGQTWGAAAQTNFTVATAALAGPAGNVRVAGSKQYLEGANGQALRLLGENVAWPGNRGTYDYDDWFGAMLQAGENHARIWMCPWAFGLETETNTLTHYRLDRAWQLDYVLQLAEQRGIYLLLCLDYHGMFEVTPDYWGGNNYWPSNPYNVVNGGPCVNQDAFFTNTLARTIYQKRLRYLVGRYGYSPNLLAWQFLNEIDNVYAYLVPADVAAWHGVMGRWLRAQDPFGHLVTTSLTGLSDRPEIWSLPEMDFATYHSYGEPTPASRLGTVAQSFLQRYGKPVLIDEFGVDWRGWNRDQDPFLRGFRQGLWGGALGGSVGSAMSWWWENIQAENVYPIYSALGAILNRTGWGKGNWTSIGFATSGTPPPLVGDLLAGGQSFDSPLTLNSTWGAKPPGKLAVPNSAAAGYAASTLNCFVHGTAHADLRTPFQLSAWFTNDARLVLHLNSVSSGSILVVRANGAQLYRTNLPNPDGYWSVTNEYNLDLAVNVPAGKQLIEITNAGEDWFYLDWVRLEGVRPATYVGNWQPSPEAIGLRGGHESLLYVVAPGVSFPASATNASLPLQNSQKVSLTNWTSGRYFAEWYAPLTGASAGSSEASSSNAVLTLPLPDFQEDLAGVVYPAPVLTTLDRAQRGDLQIRFDSETGGRYVIETSANLLTWSALFAVTNGEGTMVLTIPAPANNAAAYFRAVHSPWHLTERGPSRPAAR